MPQLLRVQDLLIAVVDELQITFARHDGPKCVKIAIIVELMGRRSRHVVFITQAPK